MNKIALLILLFTPLLSCSSNSGDNGLDWLLIAVPANDAENAISNGDFRFVGLSGMLLNEVPRLDKNCEPAVSVRYIHIDDVITSYKERKLQVIAPVYAEAYNNYLIDYSRKNNLTVCDYAHNKASH